MKEYVNVKEFIEEVDAMAKRGTLLARGGVTQEDLAMQIKGIAVHVAMKGKKYMKKVKIISCFMRIILEKGQQPLPFPD